MTLLFSPKREQQTEPALDVDALKRALVSVALRHSVLNHALKLHRDLQSLTPTAPSTAPSTAPPTPPPDHELDLAKSRELEKNARKHLSEDGCPPCYPADLGFPLQDIPDEYEKVISYWRSIETGRMGELHAQYSDWERFRQYQEKIRRYHLHRQTFHVYLENVRDRLRRHGLEHDSFLRSDRQQQDGYQNWVEFQNYHLTIYESIEEERKIERGELDDARKQSKDTGPSGIRGMEDIETFEYRLRYAERRLRRHENLLQWIEQQRIAMAAGQAKSVHANGTNDDDQAQIRKAQTRVIRTSSASHRRKGQKAHSALSAVRSGVSKKTPERRTLRLQKRDVPPTAEDTSKASSTFQQKKPRPARKSTPLRPFRSQRVSKATKNARAPHSNPASVNTKPRPTSRLRRRKPIIQPNSVIIQCSGRVSKRPARFCPG